MKLFLLCLKEKWWGYTGAHVVGIGALVHRRGSLKTSHNTRNCILCTTLFLHSGRPSSCCSLHGSIKATFSFPGFAEARCAFHNMPIIQPFTVAIAFTMTLLICPIAWLPRTSVPTQYDFRYAFHIYFQAKEK